MSNNTIKHPSIREGLGRLRPLHVSQLRNLLEREDADGNRIPFSISYACMNGGVVDVEDKCMVCIGVDPQHHRRTIKSTTSKEIRTIHDILILRVNDSKIVVS